MKIITKNFNKPLVITEKEYKDLKNSIKCWIHKKQYKKEDVKLTDSCHIAGKDKDLAHNECSLNLNLIKKEFPGVFHDLQYYE